MSLNKFIAEVKNGGLARTSRFSVVMGLPSALQRRSFGAQNLEKILLFCDSVQLPGISFSTTQSRTFGEYREIPYEKVYEAVSLTFYVDTEMYVKYLWDEWIASIQNQTTRTFNYYKEYTTELAIGVHDLADKTRYDIKLYEVYPRSISPIQMDYASKDFMKLTVNLNYRRYESILFNAGTTGNQFEQREQFNLNGVVPRDYLNNYGQFQGRFNDFNRTVQNGAFQLPSQNVINELGGDGDWI